MDFITFFIVVTFASLGSIVGAMTADWFCEKMDKVESFFKRKRR